MNRPITNTNITKTFFVICGMICAALIFALPIFAQSQTQPRTDLFDTRDGRRYRVVKMPDGRSWFAQNLNFETESGSWCYDDDAANCEIYGRLYDWETVVSACAGIGHGWRLPTGWFD